MIEIKPGVKLIGVQPQALLTAPIVDGVLSRFDANAVITSGVEGVHKRASAHVTGRALDYRRWEIKIEDIQSAVAQIRAALGGDEGEYDVILEETHIHVEWDPKS